MNLVLPRTKVINLYEVIVCWINLLTYGLNIILIKYLIFEEIYVERGRKDENMIKELKQLRRPANRGCLLTFSWRLVHVKHTFIIYRMLFSTNNV